MKSTRFILLGGLLLLLVAYVSGIRYPVRVTAVDQDLAFPAMEVHYPLIDPSQKSHIPEPNTEPVILPVAAAESVAVIAPVQPLEERGDAMLFEIDALQGMPFDQAITMPFD
ncbi:MAG: hypothetical protein V3V05_03590 [Pontiella sp.]